MSKQLFTVEITRSVTSYFENIEANSPEEAEDIALRYIEDGDLGQVDPEDTEITDTFAYPSESDEE